MSILEGVWQPKSGDETSRLIEYLNLPSESASQLEQEAKNVLSKCLPPTAASGSDTGLVIGYIQSGKTMSFTAVAALARDNGYRLIIQLSGITTNLFEQSKDRLERDLQVRQDRRWQFFANPKVRPEVTQRIAAALDWEDALPGFEKQTVLIAVMKNRTHLNNLATLLETVNLTGVPTLVIDDEADQASLNNKINKGQESATYRRIVGIRRLIPHHTFLQYTATPQALLLINLIDLLSPSFVALLTPGPAYVGGKTFFERDFKLVRRIPQNEIPSKVDRLFEPPNTLLDALRIFYLGVALGLMRDMGQSSNRSMMVHPAKETLQHADYVGWVRTIQQTWDTTFALNAEDSDRQDLMRDFHEAYVALAETAETIPSFEEIEPYLRGAVKRTSIVELNAAGGKTPQVDWHQNYAYILVGGEVLNRGYTVEGLTVTYMPRSIGDGNADTIQQRARWFGYKSEYLGLCRVFLSDEMCNAYVSYVNHDENIRKQMRNLLGDGRSIRDWKRAFFLSNDLRPTRREVLDRDYIRGNFSNSWFYTRAPHESDDAITSNSTFVREFLGTLDMYPDRGNTKRTEIQKHLVAEQVNLANVYRDLLTKFRMANSGDSQRFTGLLLQISSYLEGHPDAYCAVYEMSSGKPRERGLDKDGEIINLFQGSNSDSSDEIYPGDRQIRTSNGRLTVQIHWLDLNDEHVPVAVNVPALAIWVPKEMAGDWLVQEQG